MQVDKIKEGRIYPYRSRCNEGRGKVVEKVRKRTGDWIMLHDKKRNVSVTVRPSQVG